MRKKYPDLVKNLTSNPFPDTLEVTPNRAEDVDKLYQSIVSPHKPPGVDGYATASRSRTGSSRSRT